MLFFTDPSLQPPQLPYVMILLTPKYNPVKNFKWPKNMEAFFFFTSFPAMYVVSLSQTSGLSLSVFQNLLDVYILTLFFLQKNMVGSSIMGSDVTGHDRWCHLTLCKTQLSSTTVLYASNHLPWSTPRLVLLPYSTHTHISQVPALFKQVIKIATCMVQTQ